MFTEFLSYSRGLRDNHSSKEYALARVELNCFALVTLDISL
jgi:hypothetical protein